MQRMIMSETITSWSVDHSRTKNKSAGENQTNVAILSHIVVRTFARAFALQVRVGVDILSDGDVDRPKGVAVRSPTLAGRIPAGAVLTMPVHVQP